MSIKSMFYMQGNRPVKYITVRVKRHSKDNVCNLCGKELDAFDKCGDFSIHKDSIGYGSDYDGEGADLRLCCNCFDRLVRQCVVSPLKE